MYNSVFVSLHFAVSVSCCGEAELKSMTVLISWRSTYCVSWRGKITHCIPATLQVTPTRALCSSKQFTWFLKNCWECHVIFKKAKQWYGLWNGFHFLFINYFIVSVWLHHFCISKISHFFYFKSTMWQEIYNIHMQKCFIFFLSIRMSRLWRQWHI